MEHGVSADVRRIDPAMRVRQQGIQGRGPGIAPSMASTDQGFRTYCNNSGSRIKVCVGMFQTAARLAGGLA